MSSAEEKVMGLTKGSTMETETFCLRDLPLDLLQQLCHLRTRRRGKEMDIPTCTELNEGTAKLDAVENWAKTNIRWEIITNLARAG
jgi:hypothetical protein